MFCSEGKTSMEARIDESNKISAYYNQRSKVYLARA